MLNQQILILIRLKFPKPVVWVEHCHRIITLHF